MQNKWARLLTTVITLGLMVMIFCFSMEPAEESDATSGMIAEKVADFLQPKWRQYAEAQKADYFNGVQHIVRKCAHFTEFALLGLSLRLCLESWFGRRKWLLPVSWAGGTVYAMTDELHQLLIDGRSGQWTDVMIDSAGVLTGVVLISACLLLIRKRRAGSV